MNIEIQIKDFYSADIENVWDWKPSDAKKIYFTLDIYIGESNQDSSTIFSLIVASPEAFANIQKSELKNGEKGYLIIENYTFEKVERAINETIKACSKGKTTAMEVYKSLSKIFFWEYDENK